MSEDGQRLRFYDRSWKIGALKEIDFVRVYVGTPKRSSGFRLFDLCRRGDTKTTHCENQLASACSSVASNKAIQFCYDNDLELKEHLLPPTECYPLETFHLEKT